MRDVRGALAAPAFGSTLANRSGAAPTFFSIFLFLFAVFAMSVPVAVGRANHSEWSRICHMKFPMLPRKGERRRLVAGRYERSGMLVK